MLPSERTVLIIFLAVMFTAVMLFSVVLPLVYGGGGV